MSFNKENFYQDGNSEEYFFSRTNPLANAANAEILKIEECGDCCDLELYVNIGTVEGQTTFTFTAPTCDYDTKYLKVQITDGKGNFVTGVESGECEEIVIDTTGLSGDDWSVILEIAIGENDITSCDCVKKFSFEYDPELGLFIDTISAQAPVLKLAEVGGTIGVTSIDLGSFPDGANIPFQVELHNTGKKVLNVASATPNADVLSATLPQFAGVIYPGHKYTLSAVADGTLGAGAQTGSIDFVSDGGNITLSVAWTLV